MKVNLLKNAKVKLDKVLMKQPVVGWLDVDKARAEFLKQFQSKAEEYDEQFLSSIQITRDNKNDNSTSQDNNNLFVFLSEP